MDVFNYRHMADTYQAPTNSLNRGDSKNYINVSENVMPPRSVNTHDTATMSTVASALNDPNVVYKTKSGFTPDEMVQRELRKTEMNINGVATQVNVMA